MMTSGGCANWKYFLYSQISQLTLNLYMKIRIFGVGVKRLTNKGLRLVVFSFCVLESLFFVSCSEFSGQGRGSFTCACAFHRV